MSTQGIQDSSNNNKRLKTLYVDSKKAYQNLKIIIGSNNNKSIYNKINYKPKVGPQTGGYGSIGSIKFNESMDQINRNKNNDSNGCGSGDNIDPDDKGTCGGTSYE